MRRGSVLKDSLSLVGAFVQAIQPYLSLIFTLYALIAAVIIFIENRNPDRTIAWLLVLFFLPVVGFFLYLFFGSNYRFRRKMQHMKGKEPSLLDLLAERQARQMARHASLWGEYNAGMVKTIRLLLANSRSPVGLHNEVEVLTNGEATFAAIKEKLREARETIHLEYFTISSDSIGNEIKEILIDKARQGVKIRIIYDSVGSWGLKKSYIQSLRQAGVAIHPFIPISFPALRRDVNFRNHRKIVVVDGRYGFMGGLNIGDEYLGLDPHLGFWRDTHLMVEGEGVHKLQEIFLNDWKFCSKERLPREGLFKEPRPDLPHKPLQIVPSGPDTQWEAILQGYFSLITSARDRVWVTTPYLVPESSLSTALKVAALSGIDVRVIIPDRADHYFVFWASRSNVDDLLEAGIRIFSYKGGFIHSKIVVVDGQISSAGTANMDMRSLEINFEVQMFVYDPGVAERFERDFLWDMKSCEEFTLEKRRNRPFLERVQEAAGRLLSAEL